MAVYSTLQKSLNFLLLLLQYVDSQPVKPATGVDCHTEKGEKIILKNSTVISGTPGREEPLLVLKESLAVPSRPIGERIMVKESVTTVQPGQTIIIKDSTEFPFRTDYYKRWHLYLFFL